MDNKYTELESLLRRYRPSGPPDRLKDRILHSKPKKTNRLWHAIAASILLALTLTAIWKLSPQPTPPETQPLTIDQIKQQIQRAGQAAQLLAVADILADQPESRQRALHIYNEIAQNYPDLNTAQQAKSKLQSLTERPITQ